ncbi:MAG: hypothetical protein IPK62_05540 [Bacteroidetes bacterium]|nr:hypothetical protein [Bacteroidota bacterium]
MAQEIKIPDYTYCELLGYRKILSMKVSVSIDYGQETTIFQDNRIRDEETGKVKNFNSMVDALNYMGEKGWEFVQALVVIEGNQNVYHWLLKRRLTDEEKKTYTPITKKDLKSKE